VWRPLRRFDDRATDRGREQAARGEGIPAQKKLAEKTGVNQSEISTLESGQANPTYKTLQTLAAALGGKIELVFG
jgi:transcriptional regulator with XRE-family HTH domain